MSILFVALSHCDKQKISLLHWMLCNNQTNRLSHWVTATNKICISCQKFAKSVNNAQFFCTVDLLLALVRTFMPYFALFEDICCCFLELFGNIHWFCLLQWLTATKNSVCCSVSVPQTKILSVAVTQCDKQ